MIYLYIFIILLLFSWMEIKGLLHKSQNRLQVLVTIVFILVAGLRYETGVDWAGYEYYLNKIIPLDKAFADDDFKSIFLTLDYGYALFNSVVKMFGGGVQIIFIIVSIVSNILLLKNLRYYTKYVLTGFLVYYAFYFFVYDMSGLRQGLAIQVIFYAFRFIENKNIKKYLFFVFLAGTIHWTAYILFILYFFVRKNISKYTIIIVAICTILFTFKIEIIGKLVPDLGILLKTSDLLSGKFTAYTTNETFSEFRSWNLITSFNFLRMIILLYLVKRIKNWDVRTNIFYNLLLIEFICYFGLFELSEVSERLRFYFNLSEIVLITVVIYNIKGYFLKDMMYGFLCVCTFFNCAPYVLEFPSTVAYHPYQNYIKIGRAHV